MEEKNEKEKIFSYFSDEMEIIKRGDGEYCYPIGSSIDINTTTLDDLLRSIFDRFQTLIDILNEGEHENLGNLFAALTREAQNQTSEILSCINRKIGTIYIDSVKANGDSFPYREGRIIDVELTPSEKPKDTIAA